MHVFLAHLSGEFLKNAIVVLVITLCCLLLFEAGLRLFKVIPDTIPRPVFYSDLLGDFEPHLSTSETLCGSLKYSISTNSQGLRGKREFSLQKPDNTLRVLCIGDSFTYGTGVDDEFTYPELLRIYLAEKFPGMNIEVINAGVFLYDIVDEYDYYKDKGHKLNADIVILQYYVNDLEGMTRWFFRPKNKGNEHSSRWKSLLRQTAIYNLAAYFKFKINGKSTPALSVKERAEQYGEFIVQGTEEQLAVIFNQDRLLREENYDAIAADWNMYQRVLKTFKDTVESNGSQFLLLLLPDESQLTTYSNAPSHALVPWLEKFDVSHVDMLHHLRSMKGGNSKPFYNSPCDFHFNRFGNTLTAKSVSKAIEMQAIGATLKPKTRTPYDYRTYRDGIETRVAIAEGGALGVETVPGVRSATASSSGLETQCARMHDDTVCQAFPSGHAASPGTLWLDVEYDRPMHRMTVFVPHKVGAAGTGGVNMSYSVDGGAMTTVDQYTNAGKSTPDAFENVAFFEIDLEKPCRSIRIEYRLQGNAAIFSNEDPKDFRQIKIIAYEPQ